MQKSTSALQPVTRSPTLRVCLGSFTQPWTFGPYARQLVILATELAKKHAVLWLALGYQDTNVKIKVPNLPEQVGFVGGGFPRNTGIYVSDINSVLRQHEMDVLITLCDLNRLFVDEMWSPLSIAWFPNHFVHLDTHSRHALTAYDAVAVLGPSDATRVQEQLPHKHVVHVPHVIEDPGKLGKASRAKLREKYGVPADKFVALVNFANYDGERNRKSIDLSLMAWRDFHQGHRDSLLYLHAVALPTDGVHLPGLLAMTEVLPDSYMLDTRELKYEESLELSRMADVLLQPSKTEGTPRNTEARARRT
jgi:hypothetical protein